jgi:predicted amidophosphoribosyltransferase
MVVVAERDQVLEVVAALAGPGLAVARLDDGAHAARMGLVGAQGSVAPHRRHPPTAGEGGAAVRDPGSGPAIAQEGVGPAQLSEGIRRVEHVWFPVRCAACGATGASPCLACLRRFRPAPALAPPVGLDDLVALAAYDAAVRPFLTGAKYRDARAALAVLGAAASRLLSHGDAVLCWAPTTDARRRERGFDHAELLARTVAATAGAAAPSPLLRRLPGLPQTGRSAVQRRREPPAFVATGPAPHRVVVVDDVCTTGATLTAAASALRAAGATQLVGLVIGRTPRPGSMAGSVLRGTTGEEPYEWAPRSACDTRPQSSANAGSNRSSGERA